MPEWICDLNGKSILEDVARGEGNTVLTIRGPMIVLKETLKVAKQKRRVISPASRYMPISEAARISGFCRDTVKNYVADERNGIGFTRVKGRWFIERKSFSSFLDRLNFGAKRRGNRGRPRYHDPE